MYHKWRNPIRGLKPKHFPLLVLLAFPLTVVIFWINYIYELLVLGEATYEIDNLRITVISIILLVIFGLCSTALSILSLRERPLPELQHYDALLEAAQ